MNETKTDDRCNPIVLATLRKRVMPPLMDKLKSWQAELGRGSIDKFSEVVNVLIASAMTGLTIIFGKGDMTHFERPTRKKAFEWIVGELNSALPVDHDYIISILFIGYDDVTRFIALSRKTLPHYRTFADTHKIPICWAETEEDVEKGRFHITRILSPYGELPV